MYLLVYYNITWILHKLHGIIKFGITFLSTLLAFNFKLWIVDLFTAIMLTLFFWLCGVCLQEVTTKSLLFAMIGTPSSVMTRRYRWDTILKNTFHQQTTMWVCRLCDCHVTGHMIFMWLQETSVGDSDYHGVDFFAISAGALSSWLCRQTGTKCAVSEWDYWDHERPEWNRNVPTSKPEWN